MSLQPASYFDQVATNLTADWASGLLGRATDTPRIADRSGESPLSSLKDSVLANTLGIAAMVLDRDSRFLIRIRSSKVAIMNRRVGQFHCSASGAFALPDLPGAATQLDFSVFENRMLAEIAAELGLAPGEISIFPLAFSRDLVRAGKPQLFYLARTDLSFEELEVRAAGAQESWEFLRREDLPTDSPLGDYLDDPASAPAELFSYEGRMALALATWCISGVAPPGI
jgi:hypothetical protein